MKCSDMDCKSYFLHGMRFFFGAWLLYLGVAKWMFMGPDMFIGWITSEFDSPKTWSPHAFNVALAWVILIAEPLIGAWILSGQRARCAWMSAAMLMFILAFGQTMIMKYDVVANNWQYLVLALVCASMSAPSSSCCEGEKKTGCCNG